MLRRSVRCGAEKCCFPVFFSAAAARPLLRDTEPKSVCPAAGPGAAPLWLSARQELPRVVDEALQHRRATSGRMELSTAQPFGDPLRQGMHPRLPQGGGWQKMRRHHFHLIRSRPGRPFLWYLGLRTLCSLISVCILPPPPAANARMSCYPISSFSSSYLK